MSEFHKKYVDNIKPYFATKDQDDERLLNTINKLKQTAIVVSHRLSALNFCDKVYMIENKTLKVLKHNQIKKFF